MAIPWKNPLSPPEILFLTRARFLIRILIADFISFTHWVKIAVVNLQDSTEFQEIIRVLSTDPGIKMLELPDGKVPFENWITKLDLKTRLKILGYIERLRVGGSKKNIKAIGDKLFELKVNYGPGYRIYFGNSEEIVILLISGGDKSTQKSDIKKAKEYWREYGL